MVERYSNQSESATPLGRGVVGSDEVVSRVAPSGAGTILPRCARIPRAATSDRGESAPLGSASIGDGYLSDGKPAMVV